MTVLPVLIGGILLAGIVCVLVFLFRHSFKPKLNAQLSKAIREMWKSAEQHQDPQRKVLESAAIFDRTMKEIGYMGTLGDKLKKGGTYVPDVNAVWKAVKLRNTLAHEVGVKVSPGQAQEAFLAFKAASEAFLR